MKLTKGRLMTLIHKKNQTSKRYKKKSSRRKLSKARTLRKRKHFNLHRASLKKYRGGQPEVPKENEKEKEEGASNSGEMIDAEKNSVTNGAVVTAPQEQEQQEEGKGQQEELQAAKPEEQQEELQAAKPEEEQEEQPLQPEEEQEEQPLQPVKDGTTAPQEGETVEEEDTKLNSQQVDDGIGPGSDAPLPVDVMTLEKQQQEQKDGESQDKNNNNNNNNEDEEPREEGVKEGVGEQTEVKENGQQEEIGQTAEKGQGVVKEEPMILVESLDHLAEYLAKKIAQQLRTNSEPTRSNEDAFQRVGDASEEMAQQIDEV